HAPMRALGADRMAPLGSTSVTSPLLLASATPGADTNPRPDTASPSGRAVEVQTSSYGLSG
ncbi:MAG: hypothetical protein ACJ8DJ_16255, partial [Gemmatimonadales bacterium]